METRKRLAALQQKGIEKRKKKSESDKSKIFSRNSLHPCKEKKKDMVGTVVKQDLTRKRTLKKKRTKSSSSLFGRRAT